MILVLDRTADPHAALSLGGYCTKFLCMLVEASIRFKFFYSYYMDRIVWDMGSITINFDIELDKLTPYSYPFVLP